MAVAKNANAKSKGDITIITENKVSNVDQRFIFSNQGDYGEAGIKEYPVGR